MARPVSSFYAQIGIQTRLQDLRRVDRYLKLLEGKVRKTTAALQKDFSKTLVLPTLKIKKVQIDNTLNAQRSIQTDLNRIGRLTELRIGSVKLDEARINRQVSQVEQHKQRITIYGSSRFIVLCPDRHTNTATRFTQ
ncbi:hypothetical protein, partial [Streptococcus pneumoniae]|uniref:hypothetical protein n=1 Tax=Streptococcus pneumoniae TaxID=1313 RepID=UPI000CA81A8E